MSRKDRLKTLCVIAFTLVVATLLTTSERLASVRAYSSGPPAGYTGAPGEQTCAIAGCHGGEPNTGPGHFEIEAPQRYEPGGTIQVTVRHTTSESSRRRWGFQLTALTSSDGRAGTLHTDGTLNILTDDGPGFNRQYIEHDVESTFLGRTGGASWTFSWTAPSTNVGPVTFYAAGNQANGNGTNDGDEIYTASVTLNPPSAGLPTVAAAAVNGKKLIVSGTNFDFGAELLLDGKKQKKTTNDEDNPTTMLIAKKAGKTIDHGATVTLQVRNTDGTLSEPFTFTRP